MKKIITLVLMTFTLVFASACSCTKGNPTSKDYSDAFASLATSIYSITKEPTVKSLSYVDSSQSQDQNYHAVGAYAIFLREAFKNESFKALDEDVVYFTSTAKIIIEEQRGEMPMNAYLKLEYEDGKIKTDLYQKSENDGDMLVIIDMEYDFDKEKLKSFDLYLYYDLGENTKMLQHYKSEGSKISVLEQTRDADYEAASSIASSRLDDIKGNIEGAKNIGDYSVEYTIAMVEQANIVYGKGTARPAAE